MTDTPSYRKVAILLMLAVTSTAPLAAQEAPRTISFDEAVAIALERNTTLKLAENAAALDAAAVRQEKMQFLPSLSLNTRTDQSYGRYFDQNEGQIFNETTESVSGGVSSSVVVFDGFANTTSLKAARLSEDASELAVARTRQSVVFEVMSNFLTLVEQQEQLRVREENLAAQEALEAQVQAYVDAGVRPISDLYQQQANVASARLALVEARRALELAKTELIGTLQLDPLRRVRLCRARDRRCTGSRGGSRAGRPARSRLRPAGGPGCERGECRGRRAGGFGRRGGIAGRPSPFRRGTTRSTPARATSASSISSISAAADRSGSASRFRSSIAAPLERPPSGRGSRRKTRASTSTTCGRKLGCRCGVPCSTSNPPRNRCARRRRSSVRRSSHSR